MRRIKLIYDMPRTTFDWPPIWSEMEVEDDVAENLVYSRCAEYIDIEEDDFDDPNLEDELSRLDSAEVGLDDDSDFEADDFDDFGDDEPEISERPKKVKKPRTVDPKNAWLKYARSMGYTGEDHEITKNQLVARYGQ